MIIAQRRSFPYSILFQGLSMYLFLFAFLGNSFYVLSILSSPNMRGSPAESSMYLIESMP